MPLEQFRSTALAVAPMASEVCLLNKAESPSLSEKLRGAVWKARPKAWSDVEEGLGGVEEVRYLG